MRLGTKLAIPAALLGLTLAGQALADPVCGMNNGQAVTGEPILVGGIYGDADPVTGRPRPTRLRPISTA